MHHNLYPGMRVAAGAALSSALALLASLLFSRSTWKTMLPLIFMAVLVLLSKRFGVGVSVFGSIIAAVIFALFLFSPVGSTRVENRAEKVNLAWMVVGAISVSYLLYPRTPASGERR